eukprot:TRINITY_DN38702_c0_g1_i1.p1 TRINITY_DN38702_c0_g1~~TRINITY_DN38702_c0_g1_i1.p1  ORF type:complete len:490 (-),score=75.90 TRINITY_DN38702_c0_g1_i1:20-1456(-)
MATFENKRLSLRLLEAAARERASVSKSDSVGEAAALPELLSELMQGSLAGASDKHARHQGPCLTSVPCLPAVVTELYSTPRDAEVGVVAAFRNLMPQEAAAASAQQHGVLTTSARRPRVSPVSGSGGRVFARPWRAEPTYTSPLPPLARPLPAPPPDPGNVARPLLRSKDADFGVGLAGQLQVLSASVLRINAKSLRGLLSQQVMRLPEDASVRSQRHQHDCVREPKSTKEKSHRRKAIRLKRSYEPTAAGQRRSSRAAAEPAAKPGVGGEEERDPLVSPTRHIDACGEHCEAEDTDPPRSPGLLDNEVHMAIFLQQADSFEAVDNLRRRAKAAFKIGHQTGKLSEALKLGRLATGPVSFNHDMQQLISQESDEVMEGPTSFQHDMQQLVGRESEKVTEGPTRINYGMQQLVGQESDVFMEALVAVSSSVAYISVLIARLKSRLGHEAASVSATLPNTECTCVDSWHTRRLLYASVAR